MSETTPTFRGAIGFLNSIIDWAFGIVFYIAFGWWLFTAVTLPLTPMDIALIGLAAALGILMRIDNGQAVVTAKIGGSNE